jgi:histidinol phosphatase-like PHP family hydrolase
MQHVDPVAPGHLNGVIAGLLRDLADTQQSPQRRWGYKRAAAAVRDLDVPIESCLQPDGTLRKIPSIGPASTRIILDVLRTGRSEQVEEAVAASDRAADIHIRRTLRQQFLTRAQVRGILDRQATFGLSPAACQGDLQMHSVWSDGSQTLDDIIAAGLSRGYRYSAVTDHSYGLPIAGGLSMARLAEQHEEIDRLNAQWSGRFRLLKGIEANIRPDGTVDMQPDELRRLEIVVAAPHSVLRSPKDQTGRLLQTVATPGVNILGHPRGRLYGSRPGVAADWQRVFAAAARCGVAIEIDGDPARQDIDYALARSAVDAGCLFALDSDAHGTADFAFADTALAHAQLARVPADHVVNTWNVERLLAWAREAWQR